MRQLLDAAPDLCQVWVRGEISNFRRHGSGHLYFTLKDETAVLRAVMFRRENAGLAFAPGDGLRVLARGQVSVYERDGVYQLYVREMRTDGVGTLYEQFERLKARLAQAGLFAAEAKRPLPLFPQAVGVVTSASGAALQDILRVAAGRFPSTVPGQPGIPVVIAPAQVQGLDAPADLVRALRLVRRHPQVEVVILARGGGSIEDLWAFNDEALAREIRSGACPVVTGVGHETDLTIADLAADVRAATPSNAAEMVFPSRQALLDRVTGARDRLYQSLVRLVSQAAQRVDYLEHRLEGQFRLHLERVAANLGALAGRLEALSPRSVLGRGYSICRRLIDGRLVASVESIGPGERVLVEVVDGSIGCAVETVKATPSPDRKEAGHVQ